MGCNVSRLDANGATLPARLRPLFLQRLEEIKARRHAGRPGLKDPTPSKKELLCHIDQEDNNPSQHLVIEDSVKKPEQTTKGTDVRVGELRENEIGKNDDVKRNLVKNEMKESPIDDPKAKIEDSFTDADEDEVDDDDDDERMIGYEDDDAFPGSPSFRVYFKDNPVDCHNDTGKIETISSDDGEPISKVIRVIYCGEESKKRKKKEEFQKGVAKESVEREILLHFVVSFVP
ncbi:hypothetical protein DH2020_018945 [Rehmannia glutinosa]|uniref:Uncharacterized protein n=1 Tax=Rehmannia glutinosa TaxID=99300 RepID=A0ABR0WKC9_REHGL